MKLWLVVCGHVNLVNDRSQTFHLEIIAPKVFLANVSEYLYKNRLYCMYVRWIPYAYLNFCEKREKRETPCKLRECYLRSALRPAQGEPVYVVTSTRTVLESGGYPNMQTCGHSVADVKYCSKAYDVG